MTAKPDKFTDLIIEIAARIESAKKDLAQAKREFYLLARQMEAEDTGAEQAKPEGVTRFCMGAAWCSPNDRQVDEVAEATGDLEPASRECSDQPPDRGAGKTTPRATRVRAARIGAHDRGGTNRDVRVDDPLVVGSFVDVDGDPCVVSSRRRIEHFPR